MRAPSILTPSPRDRMLRTLARAFSEASVHVVHNPDVLRDELALGEVLYDALRAAGFNIRDRVN